MHERLFPMEKKPDDFRTVSNILYNEVKKHKENRHLNYVFDDDFVSKQQEQCNKAYLTVMTHKIYVALLPLKSFFRSISTKMMNFRKIKERLVWLFLAFQMTPL